MVHILLQLQYVDARLVSKYEYLHLLACANWFNKVT